MFEIKEQKVDKQMEGAWKMVNALKFTQKPLVFGFASQNFFNSDYKEVL